VAVRNDDVVKLAVSHQFAQACADPGCDLAGGLGAGDFAVVESRQTPFRW
jgi:hypothetical protein